VHAADGAGRPLSQRPQVLTAQFFPASPHSGEVLTLWLWHR
jgi:hypothetical protein